MPPLLIQTVFFERVLPHQVIWFLDPSWGVRSKFFSLEPKRSGTGLTGSLPKPVLFDFHLTLGLCILTEFDIVLQSFATFQASVRNYMVNLIVFLFAILFAFKGVFFVATPIFALWECQGSNNDSCYISSTAAQEKSFGQTSLVLTSSGNTTTFTCQPAANSTSSRCSSFEGHRALTLDCFLNGDLRSNPMEMQNVQTAQKTQCAVLRQLPATMAECDRPLLHPRFEAAAESGVWTISTDTMATTRLADALAGVECSRSHTIPSTTTEAKERKRQQDSKAGATTRDAPCSADDDAHYGSISLYGNNATDAADVSESAHAISHAYDAGKSTSATTTANPKLGQDAGANAAGPSKCGNAISSNHANDAGTTYAQDASCGDCIDERGRCRSAWLGEHDARPPIRTSRRHAEEGPESPDQVWPADLHGSPCGSHGFGQRKAQLRPSSPCQEPAPRNVEKVPVRCGSALAKLCCPIHGAGEEASARSECPQGITHLRKEGFGEFQDGQAGLRRCAKHHIRRGDGGPGGPGDVSCGTCLCQDHRDHGRPCDLPAISSSGGGSNGGRRGPFSQKTTHWATQRRRSSYGTFYSWAVF